MIFFTKSLASLLIATLILLDQYLQNTIVFEYGSVALKYSINLLATILVLLLRTNVYPYQPDYNIFNSLTQVIFHAWWRNQPSISLSKSTLITLYDAKKPSSIPCLSEYV